MVLKIEFSVNLKVFHYFMNAELLKKPESIALLWKSIWRSTSTTASDHFDIRGVLSIRWYIWSWWISLTSLAWNFATKSISYFSLSLFKGKLCLVTFHNPSMQVLNTWLRTPLFDMIKYDLVWRLIYLQTVVNGRALRIVVDDTNGCATVTDRDLGYKSSKCTGDSSVSNIIIFLRF